MTPRSRGRAAAARRAFTSTLSLESLETRETPAAVGGVDPSFSTNGILTTTFGGTETVAGVAIQSNGKIVVAGTTVSGGNSDWAVARYNPDGSLDTSFDTDGKATIDFSFMADDEVATCVTIQDDGKIVVGGYGTVNGQQDFFVARMKTDGSPDTDFSTNGRANFNFDGGGTDNDRAHAVTMQYINGQRMIVLAGTTDQTDVIAGFNVGVVRVAENGTVESKFHRSFGGDDTARAVAIDSSNLIVVAGDRVVGGVSNFGLVRFTEGGNGMVDGGFNGGFIQQIDIGANDTVAGMVIQPDGKIVVVGNTSAGVDFAVARFTSDGELDPSYGTGGKNTPTLGGNDTAHAVALQDDGKIVIVGTTDVGDPGKFDFAVMRLNPDGSFDAAFDGNGKKGIGQGDDDTATGVAIDPNGRIVIAGHTTLSDDFALARLMGTVEEGRSLAVGGGANGVGLVFATQADGTYNPAPVAALSPFAGFGGNVRTAVADVNGDGVQDTILATGPGATRFAVVSGEDNSTVLVAPTDPFGDPNFTGGLFVAAADLDGDGKSEVILSPDQGGGPRVSAFSVGSGAPAVVANFFGIDDPNFRGGARVAAGDVNGDGVPDLGVAAGFLGGPRVALFDGKTVTTSPTRIVNDFFGFPGTDAQTLRNGAFLSLGDVDGDGNADLILGGGPGGAPRVFVLSGAQLAAGNVAGAQAAPVANFFVAGNATDTGGVRVSAKDADGDHKADIAVGSGDGVASRVRVYFGDTFGGGGEPAGFQDFDPFAAVLANGVFVG